MIHPIYQEWEGDEEEEEGQQKEDGNVEDVS